MAAPNQSRVTANIVRIAPAGEVPDKKEVDLQALEVTPVGGPTFAKPGERLNCFTFEDLSGYSVGDQVVVEVEYIGDARRGTHQITSIARRP